MLPDLIRAVVCQDTVSLPLLSREVCSSIAIDLFVSKLVRLLSRLVSDRSSSPFPTGHDRVHEVQGLYPDGGEPYGSSVAELVSLGRAREVKRGRNL